MKRLLCLLLSLTLLLAGCRFASKAEAKTTFYYCRTEYSYGEKYGVISPEQREISANTSDLKNLLALYLVGPLDEELTSPFIGTKLLSATAEEGHVMIELKDTGKVMTDVQFHLGCACMAMTCLEFDAFSQVSITCGNRSATMDRDNLLLYDSITPIETTTEDTQ